jgi:hypothetical protein
MFPCENDPISYKSSAEMRNCYAKSIAPPSSSPEPPMQ